MGDRRRKLLWLMVVGGGMLMLLSGLALVYLNSSLNRVKTPTPASESDVQRVTPADAKAALDSGSAVFVDVRDSSSYERSHIPGALLIPLNELNDHLGELDKSSWIITYCT